MSDWQKTIELIGIVAVLLEVILLRRRVKKLEKDIHWTTESHRGLNKLVKIHNQRYRIFTNKQKQINHSLDKRIIQYGERLQKTRQLLSALRRDVLLNDGSIADANIGKR